MKKILCSIALLLLAAGLAAGGQEEDFLQVTGPCRLVFPADHGPHDGYRTEWWYYTGHLTASDGRRYGFQLTFFRYRLKPPSARRAWPEPPSAWRTDQIYFAHAALTDIAGGNHWQAEQSARPVLALAGAVQEEGGAWRIHLKKWQARIAPGRHRLQAEAEKFAFTLDLQPDKQPVLHGQEGYSRKGQSPERASCYYSFTRLAAQGTLILEGISHAVQGSAWMDHEFSTAPLQPGLTGWDWFSLQLSDGAELMVFLLRRPDGGLDPASSGTWVLPSGQTRHLALSDLEITPLAYWTSPHSGGRYPVRWRVKVAPLQLELMLAADVADQEMRTGSSTRVTYWEGSVGAQGSRQAQSVEAVGYVELTGYAEPFQAPL